MQEEIFLSQGMLFFTVIFGSQRNLAKGIGLLFHFLSYLHLYLLPVSMFPLEPYISYSGLAYIATPVSSEVNSFL